MLIDFDSIEPVETPNFKGGTGITELQTFSDENNRIITVKVRPGATIGMHIHDTSTETIFVISGQGRVECDGRTELVSAGSCHYCPKGSSHSIINTGVSDLLMRCVVANH